MAWFRKKSLPDIAVQKVKAQEGLWEKCRHCREIIYKKELLRNLKVCPKCNYHFPISVEERIAMVLDEGSFVELAASLISTDPLQFKDTLHYKDRLKSNYEKTGRRDALVLGDGKLNQHDVVLSIFNFDFMGGSMGSVVGEKIVRGIERAIERRVPFMLFCASGGARIQEGVFSLMQMAKTGAALARLHEARLFYLSILTDPTYGGVTASVAMLGDVIIAEPMSLIGFAGPRVIEGTLKQKLPEGFQRAEFLLEHGMIDMIVERRQLRETLSRLLSVFRG